MRLLLLQHTTNFLGNTQQKEIPLCSKFFSSCPKIVKGRHFWSAANNFVWNPEHVKNHREEQNLHLQNLEIYVDVYL